MGGPSAGTGRVHHELREGEWKRERWSQSFETGERRVRKESFGEKTGLLPAAMKPVS